MVVFAALDSLRDMPCSVKLPQATSQNDSAIEYLRREIVVTSKLWHHNLVHVLDTGTTEDGLPFIATESLQGSSLDEHLRNEGPMDVQQALILLLPVMGALAKAHTIGIIHCNIQPEKLFIHETANGQLIPKLLDFSVAFVEDDEYQGCGTFPTAASKRTPYSPPEHGIDADDPSPRLDVWSMSAVLYHCVMGQPPPPSGAIDVQQLGQRIGDELAKALAHGLSLQPERRYPTMTHMARALLEASFRHGVALPIDPDPDGLPAASEWRDEWYRRLERDRPTEPVGGFRPRSSMLPWMALAVVLAATTALVTASLEPREGGLAFDLRWVGRTDAVRWLQSQLGGDSAPEPSPTPEASAATADPETSLESTGEDLP